VSAATSETRDGLEDGLFGVSVLIRDDLVAIIGISGPT
jgi:hypothetical protein